MKPLSTVIYEVKLTNESLINALPQASVNDYVIIGYLDGEEISGRLQYKTKHSVHVQLLKHNAIVFLEEKMAYFIETVDDYFSSAAPQINMQSPFDQDNNNHTNTQSIVDQVVQTPLIHDNVYQLS